MEVVIPFQCWFIDSKQTLLLSNYNVAGDVQNKEVCLQLWFCFFKCLDQTLFSFDVKAVFICSSRLQAVSASEY